MSALKEVEGEVEYHVPAAGKVCKTWYKVFGDLVSATRRPLVALHGGPGLTHHYLLSLVDLTTTHGIPLVLYDQLGSGSSTHLPEKKGDASFWTEDLFRAELENLIKHLGVEDNFDLYGHSWGGMLGARFAARRPKGLQHLILADCSASMPLWVESTRRRRAQLPQELQAALSKHEQNNTTSDPEYQGAMGGFFQHFACKVNPWPENLLKSLSQIGVDPTVSHTMYGPGQWEATGTLRDWSVIDDLPKITANTLLINGRDDEADDASMQPYFQHIHKVKWIQFCESSHMPHYEERERFMETVEYFLGSN